MWGTFKPWGAERGNDGLDVTGRWRTAIRGLLVHDSVRHARARLAVLAAGVHEIELPGTTLRCVAQKKSDWPPGVFLRRPTPDDDTLPVRLGEQIRRKMKKLAAYKAKVYTTVLLLETKDGSLMDQHKMLEGVREGIGRLDVS